MIIDHVSLNSITCDYIKIDHDNVFASRMNVCIYSDVFIWQKENRPLPNMIRNNPIIAPHSTNIGEKKSIKKKVWKIKKIYFFCKLNSS